MNKGNVRTQCKRPGIHYDEFHNKYFCEKHFRLNEYLERKFPSHRRHSRSKRISFMHKFEMESETVRENDLSLFDSVSGSSEDD